MSIDERARLSLYQRLEAVLGTPEADTMMSYLPPQGWGEVATKGDLALLRGDFDSLRREWHAELAVVRAEIRAEIAAVRSDLGAEIAGLRAELYRSQRGVVLTLVTVMVALAAGQMALVAAMV